MCKLGDLTKVIELLDSAPSQVRQHCLNEGLDLVVLDQQVVGVEHHLDNGAVINGGVVGPAARVGLPPILKLSGERG